MWIYLKDYHSSAGSGELTWDSESGCNQSPTAKSSHTAKAFSCKECKKGICPKHQYGMIYEHYPLEILITNLPLTSSTEAFPARTSVLQAVEKAWRESEADFFSRSCDWPKKSSPSSYSLKMSRPSLVEEVFESLEKLPRWGMIVDGVLYPLHPLEPCIEERGGSYWLTPSTMDTLPVRTGEALENALYRGKDRKSKRKVSGRLNEQVAYPQMWPTPNARDWKDTQTQGNRKSPNLGTKVLMVTPTASQASKPIRAPSPSRANGEHGEDLQDSIGRLNPESIGKRLSVQFVELLMGYPDKWTDLNPLETQ